MLTTAKVCQLLDEHRRFVGFEKMLVALESLWEGFSMSSLSPWLKDHFQLRHGEKLRKAVQTSLNSMKNSTLRQHEQSRGNTWPAVRTDISETTIFVLMELHWGWSIFSQMMQPR